MVDSVSVDNAVPEDVWSVDTGVQDAYAEGGGEGGGEDGGEDDGEDDGEDGSEGLSTLSLVALVLGGAVIVLGLSFFTYKAHHGAQREGAALQSPNASPPCQSMENPAFGKQQSEWRVFSHPQEGNYFYNVKTKTTQWDVPAGYILSESEQGSILVKTENCLEAKGRSDTTGCRCRSCQSWPPCCGLYLWAFLSGCK